MIRHVWLSPDRARSRQRWQSIITAIRPSRADGLGRATHRHGVLYARDGGWNVRFEALVGGNMTAFIESHDSKQERCWLAERDGDVTGSVFLVRRSETVARLSPLLVEPSARGLDVGSWLVDECVRFAQSTDHERVPLWTNAIFHAASHLYERAGFQLVHREPQHSFGHDLTAETRDLAL